MPIWIRRYKIMKPSPHPRYGGDIVLDTYVDYTNALQRAKMLLSKHSDLCVVEFRYASEENLARNFEFDSHIRWASWLNNEEESK